jgi:hypothetical protein
MVKRREFGALGLSAAALLAMQAGARGDEHEEHHHDDKPGHGSGFDFAAQILNECKLECDACAHHCMLKVADGDRKHLLTLKTCLDCADVCAAVSQIAARKGPFTNISAEACADVCAICARECEKFPDDEHMMKCARACRKCEKACRDLVENAGQGLVR